MKLWKHTLISALAFFGVCTIMVYSACDRDSCLTLKCKNKAACVNGFCQCPTGYEGTECQSWAVDRYIGRYGGESKCNSEPPFTDTANVGMERSPNVVFLELKSRPLKRYTGTINGNHVSLVDADNKPFGYITLDGKKITVYSEENINGENSTCSFVGNR